jgi:hypothetical protein
LQKLAAERDSVNEAIDHVLDAANEDERDPSESERELIARYRSRLHEIEPQINELLDLEETRATARDARAALGRTKNDDGDPPAMQRTGEAVEVYTHFGQYARDEMLARYDKIAGMAGPGARERATERLARVMENTLTGDIPGIVPKQHLAQIIDVINRSRPVVDSARSVALTSGQLTYPKITQRPIVGEQTAEKTELPSRKMTIALKQVDAKVYGGAGDLSWQSIVWSNPDALNLWFELAAEAYARETEIEACAVLVGAPSFSDTVPTNDLAGWMGALTAASGAVYDHTGRRADTLYTDIATGYGLLGLVSDQSPVFLGGANGTLATGTGAIAGLRLVISYGFAGQTAIVGDSSALLAAETAGSPVQLRVVEPSIAGFEVGVVGAFLAEVVEPDAFIALAAPPVIPLTAAAPKTGGSPKAS